VGRGCFFFDADPSRDLRRSRFTLAGTSLAVVPVFGFFSVAFSQLSPFTRVSTLSVQGSYPISEHSASCPLRPGVQLKSPLPTVQIFHPTRPFMCLLRVVPLPLWCTEERFSGLSRRCLRNDLWLFHLRFYPAACLGFVHLPDANHVESPETCLLQAGLSHPCRWFSPNAADLSYGVGQTEERTLLVILLSIAGGLGFRWSWDLMPIWSPLKLHKIHCDYFHWRLLPLRPKDNSMLQPTFLEASPHQIWLYGPMALSLSFGGRRCRCPIGVQKMLIVLFVVLLSWPCLLQFFSGVPCTGTWPGIVSSKRLLLSIVPFPNWIPESPCPLPPRPQRFFNQSPSGDIWDISDSLFPV